MSFYSPLIMLRGGYEQFENENSYTITSTKIGYSHLKINNLVRFTYPVGNLHIFLNGGISNGFAISKTNKKVREVKFFSTENVVEGPALEDTRKHEQGIILGMGVKYQKFSLEFRFERSNGMSEYPGLKSTVNRFYALIGYKF